MYHVFIAFMWLGLAAYLGYIEDMEGFRLSLLISVIYVVTWTIIKEIRSLKRDP